ncbi:MAG: iron-sulfur cluster assembly protein, partial [Nitrosomonas sp.]|nr:iron-sulfur cluster assembly protein [Nitrosomonas sp.]
MAISEQQIQSALKQIIDPTTGKDYISTQSVRNIQIDQQHVSIDIELGYPANSVK